MIREICFNPVIDKMYFIENFIEGNIYRKLSSEEYAGGKGINIAKALTTYGIPNCCYVTVAGKNGKTHRVRSGVHPRVEPLVRYQDCFSDHLQRFREQSGVLR